MVQKIVTGKITQERENTVDAVKENLLDKYIVRPANLAGIGGFVFDIEGSTNITHNSEITDHYVEDNSPIQDHWALKPVKIKLQNYVGELVNRRDETVNTPIQQVVRKLTTLNAFLPEITSATENARSLINGQNQEFEEVANTTLDLYSLIKNLNPNVSRQAQAYLYFDALWRSKILVSLQTPYKFYANMAIETVIANQDEETKFQTDFQITLKEWRTTSLKFAEFDANKYQSRSASQRQEEEDKGKAQGENVQESILYQGLSAIGSNL